MNYSKKELNDISALIKLNTKDRSLIVRLNNYISYNRFKKILNYFIFDIKNNGLGVSYAMVARLYIKNKKNNNYILLNNINDIKKYWLLGILPKKDKSEINIIKRKIINSTNISSYGFVMDINEDKPISKSKSDGDSGSDKDLIDNIAFKEYIYENIH